MLSNTHTHRISFSFLKLLLLHLLENSERFFFFDANGKRQVRLVIDM